MGTNLTDEEREEKPGWVGASFRKLRQITNGEPVTLSRDEAEFLYAALDTVEHLTAFGDGYAQWACRNMMKKGEEESFDAQVPM